jgi:hypothetical protein
MARLELTGSAEPAGIVRRVRAGEDVLAIGAPRDVLDRAGTELAAECRVVRVMAGPGPLSLSGFMAQVAGNPDLTAQDDSVVELGLRRLAAPDAPGQRIVLLVDDAGQLQRAALRFVQHVLRGAPSLLLVFAGGAELEALLEDADFAGLRSRLAPAVAGGRRSRRALWTAIGAGAVAAAVVAAWAVRSPASTVEPAPSLVAALPQPAAAEPVAPVALAQPAAFPPLVVPAARATEPERLPLPPIPPRQARAKDQPAAPAIRTARAVRPRAAPPRGREWIEESPYGGAEPAYWARPSYDPWVGPPERPYADAYWQARRPPGYRYDW